MRAPTKLILNLSIALLCVHIHTGSCFTTISTFRQGLTSPGAKSIAHCDDEIETSSLSSRRQLFVLSTRTLTTSVVAAAFLHRIDLVRAAEERSGGIVSATTVADLLRAVPTFTIVDENGVPYMVVGEDAKLTAYFFVDYNEAKRILKVAADSADKVIAQAKADGEKLDADQLLNPWKQARISTIPLDTAVSLATRSNTKQVGIGNYFQVAPSESDIDDALAITGKSELADGKVPLFYYKDFTIKDKKNGDTQSPLFFKKIDLERTYKRENPGKSLPNEADGQLQVTELFAVLTEMVKPGGTDEELKTLIFVPPADSAKAAMECERKGGKEPPFVLGKRNIIL